MAELFRNKALPDYFMAVDGRQPSALASIPALYEDEKVILLTNKKISFDPDFFAKMTMPANKTYKKFKTVQYVEALQRSEQVYPTLAADCFGGDEGKARYFGEQVSSVVAQIKTILNDAAPSYRITQPRLTLRCSPTFNENLHVDVYSENIPTHHFRLFVNLDSAHRVWTTSWRLSDLLERRLPELPRKDLETLSSGALIRMLNFHVFGGLNSIYEEKGEPRHVAYFEPGEIWFVDSRRVSHQIFYGQRAISSESVVEPENMINPKHHYLTLAEARRNELLKSLQTAN